MLQIRNKVFETNSSSVHTLCICTDEQHRAWKKGELIYDDYPEKLVPFDAELASDTSRFYTAEAFENHFNGYFETFEESYVTPSGEKIIVFGYYGRD